MEINILMMHLLLVQIEINFFYKYVKIIFFEVSLYKGSILYRVLFRGKNEIKCAH